MHSNNSFSYLSRSLSRPYIFFRAERYVLLLVRPRLVQLFKVHFFQKKLFNWLPIYNNIMKKDVWFSNTECKIYIYLEKRLPLKNIWSTLCLTRRSTTRNKDFRDRPTFKASEVRFKMPNENEEAKPLLSSTPGEFHLLI